MSSYKVLTLSGSDPALAPYRNLIFTTFMKSLRFGNDWYELIDSSRYYQVYQSLITTLLDRKDVVVRLAVLSDDPDTCLGWSLAEGRTLHYVFVKNNARGEPSFRKLGIGTALLPPVFDQISHLTRTGRDIWKRKFPEVIFNPFQ